MATVAPMDNPRPWLGAYYGPQRCSKCEKLAIGYTNHPYGGNPKTYCEDHAPQALLDVRPNTLKVWDECPYPGAQRRHLIVGRWPESPVYWPDHDAWAYERVGCWYNRWSQYECEERWLEGWYELLYWEWRVLRYVLAKYSDDWEPSESPDGKYLCEVCLQVLEDRDYEYESEYMGECWGRPAYQEIAYGFVCPRCGRRGDV